MDNVKFSRELEEYLSVISRYMFIKSKKKLSEIADILIKN